MQRIFDGKHGWRFQNIPGNTLVSFMVTSQSKDVQVLQILGPDDQVVADSSVLSSDFSNLCTGSFSTPGMDLDLYTYTIRFKDDRRMAVQRETLNVGRRAVCETALFAGAEHRRGNADDICASVTWFAQRTRVD